MAQRDMLFSGPSTFVAGDIWSCRLLFLAWLSMGFRRALVLAQECRVFLAERYSLRHVHCVLLITGMAEKGGAPGLFGTAAGSADKVIGKEVGKARIAETLCSRGIFFFFF